MIEKTIERLTTLSILALLVLTIVCGFLSCGQSRPHLTPRVNPILTRSGIWHDYGIVVWDSLPVKIYVVPGMMDSVLRTDVASAIRKWNGEIGCEVLALSYDPNAEIIVKLAPRPSGTKKTIVAVSTYVFRGPWWDHSWGNDIDVYTVSLNDVRHRTNVMTHELGHALGLADLYDKEDEHYVMHSTSRYGIDIDPSAILFFKATYCEEE